MVMEEQWKLVYVLGILVLGFAQQWKAMPKVRFHVDSQQSESLKLPYLSAYLDSIGTNFRHGANFATGGSSVRPPGFSPFNLGIQISQFIQFKARTTTLYNQLSLNSKSEEIIDVLWQRVAVVSSYPFSDMVGYKCEVLVLNAHLLKEESLYPSATFRGLPNSHKLDIGQNDLGHGFQTMSENQVVDSIPHIIGELTKAIHQLYKEGARFFWIHNTGPLGCLPYNVIYGKKAGNLDKNGCVKSQNEAAMVFNRQLKDKISWLRTQLPFAKFTYVDVYSAKYALISNAKNLGLVDPLNFCCGSFYGYHINCGKKAIVNHASIHQSTLAGMAYITQRRPTCGFGIGFWMAPYVILLFQFKMLVIIK
ncbi:hypothetical protein V6N13_111844 [Hibiscus sabdariffa]